jgi:mannitol-1-phosphate 5-dehydrogenase
MDDIQYNKLVLFGAGKIGRSFIGQLFSRGGYHVVFIDVFKPVIDEINSRKNYNVIIKADKDEVLNISNIRGVYAGDEDEVVNELATAGIVAVSVGQNGLKQMFGLLAKGLMQREKRFKNHPLDIIIAENMRNADEYFEAELLKKLPGGFPFQQMVGLIETSIGKMVPIMKPEDINEDSLQIFAEPYNTLILNKKGFKNQIPAINGLAPKENIKAWVDRKLFIHNLGHAVTAYIGFLYEPSFIYIYEALAVKEIYRFVEATMMQAAEILKMKYPGEFTDEALTNHIHDLLARFRNKALGDTIFRVGCDLTRKLSPEDRLAGAIHLALEFNLPYDKILTALMAGFYFNATDHLGKMMETDETIIKVYENNIILGLIDICGFSVSKHWSMFTHAEIIKKDLSRIIAKRNSLSSLLK